ncbi:MAG TPA: pitrilysin family protein [Planctomycetota bacterium]|nr:pitrilysin family protein [Planctomycetota bacterium]
MDLSPLGNPLDEPILAGSAASGLRVLVNHRPAFRRTFAALGVNFGSVDRVAGVDGQPVPEGLAHFLEHKLFEDQEGDVSDRFAELGASANAMTGFVGTTYVVSTVEEPRRALELLLQFVQDPWFTDALVAKEQGIIAQEIRMYDDDPDWRVFFGLLGCLYQQHPAKDNIAGTVASIADIDAATLRRCYELFYHPRNMVLTVSGALPPAVVAEVAETDQARRPHDERPAHGRGRVDEPEGCRAPRWEEKLAVSRPRLLLGIKERALGGGPRALLRRELCTRMLLDLLLGRSSRTWEELYADGLVDESFSASYSTEESFGFTTIGGDSDEPERLEARLREALERARREGFDMQAFGRMRNKLHGALLRALDSPEHVGHALVTDTFRGVRPFEELELIRAITPEDLSARLDEHVAGSQIAVAIVRPL